MNCFLVLAAVLLSPRPQDEDERLKRLERRVEQQEAELN